MSDKRRRRSKVVWKAECIVDGAGRVARRARRRIGGFTFYSGWGYPESVDG
jgi:hypothetical protein